MPDHPISINLAWIVHRLLTNHRGWSVDELMQELGIADRTYRKYRRILQTEFEPLIRSNGSSMVHEIDDGHCRYLRIVELEPEEGPRDPKAFTARVAALHFSKMLLGFLGQTDVSQAVEDILLDFEYSLKDRPFVLGHILRNVDRIFFQLPDAPKDYSEKNEVITTLLHALVYTRRVSVKYSSASFDDLSLELEPLTLAVYRSGLYLIARGVGYEDTRIYAVDRIHVANLLDTKFNYPSNHDYTPEEYTEGSFGIYRGNSDTRIDFELVFDDEKWLKLYITERRWHPSQTFEDLEDGRLKMTFSVTTDVEVWPWIRRFGSQVEVLSPEMEEAAAD